MQQSVLYIYVCRSVCISVVYICVETCGAHTNELHRHKKLLIDVVRHTHTPGPHVIEESAVTTTATAITTLASL